jgi:hypothetical protein
MSTLINVQFSDSVKTKIIAYFGAPQNEDAYPNQATVDVSDARWSTFYNAMPDEVKAALPSPA